jgi:hypothetical protein
MSWRRAFWIAVLFLGGVGAWIVASRTPEPVIVDTPPPVAPATEVADAAAARAVETRPAPVAVPVPAPKPTEEEVLVQLRALVEAQPEAALALVKEAEARFPNGAASDERAWLQMKALVNLNRIADARVEATTFFEQHPQSPFAEQVFRLTGMHPRPLPPVP